MRMYISPQRKLQKIWTCRFEATLYPMTQIPPGKEQLGAFGWFDYVRPLNKDDLYEWRPKAAGTELKKVQPRVLPKQRLDDDEKSGGKAKSDKEKTAEQTTEQAAADDENKTDAAATNTKPAVKSSAKKGSSAATAKKSTAKNRITTANRKSK